MRGRWKRFPIRAERGRRESGNDDDEIEEDKRGTASLKNQTNFLFPLSESVTLCFVSTCFFLVFDELMAVCSRTLFCQCVHVLEPHRSASGFFFIFLFTLLLFSSPLSCTHTHHLFVFNPPSGESHSSLYLHVSLPQFRPRFVETVSLCVCSGITVLKSNLGLFVIFVKVQTN